MHMRSVSTLLATLGLIWAAEAQSQNEVLNPSFGSDIDPWTIGSQEFVETVWDSDDFDFSPTSGSLSIFSVTGSAYQCIPIFAGTDYDVEGWVAPILSGRVGVVTHSIEIEWFTSTICGAGTSLGRDAVTPEQLTNTWNFGSDTFIAPLSAQSARVHLQNRTATFGIARALFDEIYVPEPALGSMLGLGCAAMAFASRSRRGRP